MMRKLFFSTKPSKCFIDKKIVSERVLNVITNQGVAPSSEIINNGHFVANFQLDSLRRKELVLKLGEEFCVNIPSNAYINLMSVDSAIDYFSNHAKAR